MATRQQRVDSALQQLVTKLIHNDAEEDRAVAQQRLEDGFQLAQDIIGRHDPFPAPCCRAAAFQHQIEHS